MFSLSEFGDAGYPSLGFPVYSSGLYYGEEHTVVHSTVVQIEGEAPSEIAKVG